MDLEKRLEKWDALFEELKEVVEHFIPSIEKSVSDALSRVNALEQRLQRVESELDTLKKLQSGADSDAAEKLREELGRISREVEKQVTSIRTEVRSIKTSLDRRLDEVSDELDSKIKSIRESIPDSTVVSVPEADVKRLESEIEELKERLGKLHGEIEQLKTNMAERHRILREKRVEGRSPRLL